MRDVLPRNKPKHRRDTITYQSVPTYLEAIAFLHRRSKSPDGEIHRKEAPAEFDRLWGKFNATLDVAVTKLGDRLREIDPANEGCRTRTQKEAFSWDEYMALAENPYFLVALSVLHESLGNDQRALEVLLERSRPLRPEEFDPLVNRDFIERAPNFALRLLYLKMINGETDLRQWSGEIGRFWALND